MVLILATGVAWHKFEPGGITTQQLRSTLSALVVNLLAPTLILYVILTTPLKEELYQVPITGLITISFCLALAFILFTLLLRTGYITRPQAGALILAASFGNGMGFPYPRLKRCLALTWPASPLIYDLLATVPFVWIIAVLVAAHFGTRIAGGHLGRELLLMPPRVGHFDSLNTSVFSMATT
jgi:Predicted permeases